ncbi:MAG: hypothetical protein J6M02_03610 [Clostridia bacterium]|nr:hypothetical protein [Clostridia bacterium]
MKKIFVMLLMMVCFVNISFAAVDTDREIKLNTKVYDELSESGEKDYFSFTLSKPGSVQIEFEFDVTGKYHVKLMDLDNNKTIQNNTFDSAVNTVSGRISKEANKVRLSKGDYRVEVSSSWFNSCDERYVLRVNYEDEKGNSYEKEPNNDAKTAMLIEANRKVTGNLQASSDTDYYMVEVEEAGTIQLRLNFDDEAAYNVTLYSEADGKLKQLQSVKFSSEVKNENCTQTGDRVRVEKGVYYVKIASSWSGYSNEDYVFTLIHNFEKYGAFEKEPNEDAKTATEIFKDEMITGNMSSSRDVDFYMADMRYGGTVVLKMLVPENAQYSVVIYREENGALKKVQSETYKQTNSQNVELVSGKEFEINYGRYYFKVTSTKYSNVDYGLVITDKQEEVLPVSPNGKNVIILQLNNPYMQVNAQTVAVDGDRGTTPFLYNGRTMLPIRAVIENLGGTIEYDAYSGMSTIRLGGNLVQITTDSALVYVNGVAKYMDTTPMVVNGRTMLPLRFVIENLNGTVEWDDIRKTATITY